MLIGHAVSFLQTCLLDQDSPLLEKVKVKLEIRTVGVFFLAFVFYNLITRIFRQAVYFHRYRYTPTQLPVPTLSGVGIVIMSDFRTVAIFLLLAGGCICRVEVIGTIIIPRFMTVRHWFRSYYEGGWT
jgi:hypothetical protein